MGVIPGGRIRTSPPPGLPDENDKALSRLYQEVQDAWFALFRAFGTHYVSDLTVGGKVIYSKFMSKDQVSNFTSDDKKAGLSAAVKTISVEASAKISMALSSKEPEPEHSAHHGAPWRCSGLTTCHTPAVAQVRTAPRARR